MTRTDKHRPTEINPDDYEFVAFEFEPKTGDVLGDALTSQQNFKAIRRHMEGTGGTYSRHEHGGVCGICGNANAIYTALFHHRPTNTYIRTGRECADKLEAGLNFDHFIRCLKIAGEAKAGKRKAEAALAEKGLQAAWTLYANSNSIEGLADLWEERTILDIVGKLVRWGSISDKQFAFLGKLLEKIAGRAEVEATRQAEADAAQPVPVTCERVTIRGKILTVREQESEFYYNKIDRRMLVQAVDGWKVWGSLPRQFNVADLKTGADGDLVEFDAQIIPSRDDPKFGFFKRPTKARFIEEVK